VRWQEELVAQARQDGAYDRAMEHLDKLKANLDFHF